MINRDHTASETRPKQEIGCVCAASYQPELSVSAVTEVDRVLALVRAEVIRAKRKHPGNFHSGHEGSAVIAEEFEEMWDEIKADNLPKALHEAIQLAAMGVRFVTDLS